MVEVTIGLRGDASHCGHDVHGVATDRRLGGEHDGAGAVEDRVRHIGGFGPRRNGRLDHGLQHLCGGDSRASPGNAAPDDVLLEVRQVFDRELDAQVTPRHHDGVGLRDDGVDVLHGHPGLDLGDEQRAGGRSRHSQGSDIIGPSHEGSAEEVHSDLD